MRFAGEDPRLADIQLPEAFIPSRHQAKDMSWAESALEPGVGQLGTGDGQTNLGDIVWSRTANDFRNTLGDLSNFRTSEELDNTLAKVEQFVSKQDGAHNLFWDAAPDGGPARTRSYNIEDIHPAVGAYLDRIGKRSEVLTAVDRLLQAADAGARRDSNYETRERERLASDTERFRAKTPEDRAIEIKDEQRRIRERNRPQAVPLGYNRPGETSIIPGLPEAIASSQESYALNNLENVLRKYPEVKSLIQADKLGAEGRLRNAKQYMPYVDTEQTKINPEPRAALYNQIFDTAPPELKQDVLERVRIADDLFTSGEPTSQAQARQIFKNLGYGDEFSALETPIFDPKAPVIGGGGYVRAHSSPEFNYMADRAGDVNSAMNVLHDFNTFDKAADIYPGLKTPWVPPTEAYFELDPYSGRALEVSPAGDVRNAYGVSVTGANAPQQFQLEDPGNLVGYEVSKNVLKFLKNNPVTKAGSVSFQTQMPGESIGYNTTEVLPAEITNAYASAVKKGAFAASRPGTLASNSPIGSYDLMELRKDLGVGGDESSLVRKLQPFVDANQRLPNVRGQSYRSAGFGPLDDQGQQLSYIDLDNRVVPLQIRPGHATEVGMLRFAGGSTPQAIVSQNVLEKPSRTTFYGGLPIPEAVTPRSLAAGAGFALLNEKLPAQVKAGRYGDAAKTVATDVGTGVGMDVAIGAAASQLASRAPALAARVLPAARLLGPGAAGAGLIAQGREGSLLDVITSAANKNPIGFLPAAGRVDPKTYLPARAERAVTNEAKYLLNSILQGRLPYKR